MKDSNEDLSKMSRRPYGKVDELPHVRVAFYEILGLSSQRYDDDSQTIARLMRDIIRVTQSTPDGLQRLPPVAAGAALPLETKEYLLATAG